MAALCHDSTSESAGRSTYRDKFMENLHLNHPIYEWHKNKGYGTSHHRKSIIKYGKTNFHRKTYKLKEEQLKLDI